LEGGWIDFARKIWGSARKMNSRTNMIKEDETRKLDYIDCGKSLKNLYLHLHCLLASIFVKCYFLIFWPLAEKLLDCPKKIILPDSEGYAYGLSDVRVQTMIFELHDL